MGIRIQLLLVSAVVVLVSCKSDKPSADKSANKSVDKSARDTAGKAVAKEPARTPDKAAGHTSKSGIVWIKDDFAAATTAATKAGKPLVVDMWAPWCHTCLSMKKTVLADAGLAAHADRFIWAALDTDKPVNAAALEKLPVSAWPTFFVVAPDGSVAARFLGAGSVKQFRDFLEEGESAARAGDGSLKKGSPGWHLREGDRNASSGKMKEAATEYGSALAAAPAEWSRRPDVMVSQISALYKAGDHEACAELGKKIDATKASMSSSTPDFAYYATSCAAKLDVATAASMRTAAIAAIDSVLSSKDANLSADDRSDALRIVREQHEALGDKEAAKAKALEQKKVLDNAAASAANPFAAMTYNWPRSEVYVYLDVAEALVEPLRQSAVDLPREYDPPYRLAWILHKLSKNDEALAEIEKAEPLAYGPRKGRVLGLKADILSAKQDFAAAIATREKAIAHYRSLAPGQRSDSAIEAAEDALVTARKEAAVAGKDIAKPKK